MKILVTGCAGFIGYHVANRLLREGNQVYGLDNLNHYYDVRLKHARLEQLQNFEQFYFSPIDICDGQALSSLFEHSGFDRVIHLAAQAGVRYSLLNPQAYIESNVHGFLNILENCRQQKVQHLVYASSSSVYGACTQMPFSIHQNVDHPVSLYAATKKANELMAHSYSHLYQMPTTGLRFFTVYGPWGRPDMALFLFTKAIYSGKPIDVFNYGNMKRDFTYIDDIVDGILKITNKIASANLSWSGHNPDAGSSAAPYRIYNIGNQTPVALMDFIHHLEEALGKKANINYLPLQAGDVPETFADIEDIQRDVGFQPQTSIREGIKKFVEWYQSYYADEADMQATPPRVTGWAQPNYFHPPTKLSPCEKDNFTQFLIENSAI